ncbi:ARM repeat-containing protein [Myriangium duriaei CBS 260.36]|uniref:ARM repeat-containing protein n=1 Tax=Myriangium duriaei CBS 260.36 TaxID=1168546 RepID=A0A9P4MLE7_9PEZI|nr:ARM repeat-containing protein [Myriangium duriaei CBS 260.36]
MEEQLAHLLAETQSSQESPRKNAELQLKQLYHDQSFPLALVSLASHDSIPLNIRQAALLVCKKFVETGWSANLDEFGGQVLINDTNKSTVRQTLLDIALSDTHERKIKSAASLVVSKIATADFPEDWPNLLPDLLALIPQASDARLHGALKVLQDLVEDCLNEEQFFNVAHDLVRTVHDVAVNDARKPTLRALAISAFRSSFDTLEMVMEDHKAAVKGFAEQTLNAWMPFFLDILKSPLPGMPEEDDDGQRDMAAAEYYRGIVALKLQVVKVLMRIRSVFPSVLGPQSLALFSAVWEELSRLEGQYHASYINGDRQSRLEDADGLPYTLDFLIIEELDFMQALLRAPLVKKELERQLQSPQTAGWVVEIMKLAASYSNITTEEEGMWDMDVNIFLSEESSVTANYTPRIACADLVTKLVQWVQGATLDGLYSHIRAVYSTESDWKAKEASLYILNALLRDMQEVERSIPAETANNLVAFVNQSIQQDDDFLRARAHVVAGSLVKTTDGALAHVAPTFLQNCLHTMTSDHSDVVKVSCVRALQQYLSSIPPDMTAPLQTSIIEGLSQFLSQQDLNDLSDNDDVMVALLETLRDAICLDTHVCLDSGGLALLFTIANHGASNFQLSMLITETFEEIASSLADGGPEKFARLCEKVLPSLIGVFDVDSLEEENPLTNLAADLLAVLLEHAPSPLPLGFVSEVMPKLQRLLLGSLEDTLLNSATTAIKCMLERDAEVVFGWHDADGKGGLEVLLIIIDRLLGPLVDDNAASEVGALAAAVVEKAGSERLGPYLSQLLQAVAIRLSTAEKAPIIQSLILVFARLTLISATEVLQFLSSIQIEDGTGLQVVMAKWLEHSVHFAGYDEIRQNVIALTKLYDLSSPILSSVAVKGDLVVPQTSRIMTRSRAKQTPEQYTSVPADLKIIKVLIEELLHASGPTDAAQAAASFANNGAEDEEDGDDDDEWEDDPQGFLDLGAGITKADLMSYGMGGAGGDTLRRRDDETQEYLLGWFREVGERPGFADTYNQLSEAEKEKLRNLLG